MITEKQRHECVVLDKTFMERQQQNTNEGTGRVNQPGQTGQSQRDISDVDQQEGTMNNGELGGNFGESERQQ